MLNTLRFHYLLDSYLQSYLRDTVMMNLIDSRAILKIKESKLLIFHYVHLNLIYLQLIGAFERPQNDDLGIKYMKRSGSLWS
jgi:hypothetical protein